MRSADPLVDLAMLEALPTADLASAQHMVELLITRSTDRGLRGLLAAWADLRPELQQMVADRGAQFDSAVRYAATEGDAKLRLSAVELAARCGSTRLAYLMADQLGQKPASLSKAAAAGLLRLGRRVAAGARCDPGAPMSRSVEWLAAAVAKACAGYAQHGRRDVLLAAACLAPWRPPEVLRKLSERRAAALPALRELVRRGEDPVIDAQLLVLMNWEVLDHAAVEGLKEKRAAERVPQVLLGGAMMALPAVRAGLAKVGPAEHLMPSAAVTSTMTTEQLRALPAWVESLDAPPDLKAQVLEQVAISSDRLARLGSLRTAMAMGSDAIDAAIVSLCFDEEPTIARLALRYLVMRGYSGLSQLAVRLVGSTHDQIREMAERELTRRGFERLWTHWDQLDRATRLSAGRALMKIDRQFHRQLAERMTRGGERFRAVMMARELGEEARFEPQLLTLAGDRDERVASAAVRALGAITDSPATAAQLTSALDHPDDRVRANAVESLEKIEQVGQAKQKLQELAEHGGNRSRANAVKALLGLPVGGAMPALDAMLSDADPKQRISALWVVEQMGIAAVGQRIVDMATADGDEQVKRRALRICRMLAAMQRAEAAAAALPPVPEDKPSGPAPVEPSPQKTVRMIGGSGGSGGSRGAGREGP